MNIIQTIEAEQAAQCARRKIPEFAAGRHRDCQREGREGERTRVQAYEGVCIARNGGGSTRTSRSARFPTARASSAFSRSIPRTLTRSRCCGAARCGGRSCITCAIVAGSRRASSSGLKPPAPRRLRPPRPRRPRPRGPPRQPRNKPGREREATVSPHQAAVSQQRSNEVRYEKASFRARFLLARRLRLPFSPVNEGSVAEVSCG